MQWTHRSSRIASDQEGAICVFNVEVIGTGRFLQGAFYSACLLGSRGVHPPPGWQNGKDSGRSITKRLFKAATFKVSLVLGLLVRHNRTTSIPFGASPAILRLERGMWLVDRPRPKGAYCVAMQPLGLAAFPTVWPPFLHFLKCPICDRASPVPSLSDRPSPWLDSGMFHWWRPCS